NRIGQRIALVGQGLRSHVYEMPRNLMDFQASYGISKKSELRLNVKDIFSSPIRFYFDQNLNDKYDGVNFSNGNINPNEDWLLQSYRPGTTFTFSYIYKF